MTEIILRSRRGQYDLLLTFTGMCKQLESVPERFDRRAILATENPALQLSQFLTCCGIKVRHERGYQHIGALADLSMNFRP
ncbi:hypothetical protein D3C73_1549680 [compost metagenome]